MYDTAKYLVHADITADGVVERSDVVGAVFGQTEGLLGEELDLRELQDSSKVGRIDVDVDSENGQSFGRITIATSLDQVETAILAAALETIDRVGPCRSTIEVRRIEDVRAAKRREVVERAKTLLGESFEGSMRSSRDLVEEVREAVRVEDITEYEGLPAGPHVADSDAIVVVEGRADVLTLLRYGVKNGIAVEGTNVPDVVAELTSDRTVTAFLDGDRGGELILRELAQVSEVDYVAFAPEARSVEDLARHEVMAALREKVPYAHLDDDAPVDVPVAGEGTTADSSGGVDHGGSSSGSTGQEPPEGASPGEASPEGTSPEEGSPDEAPREGVSPEAASPDEAPRGDVSPEEAPPDETAVADGPAAEATSAADIESTESADAQEPTGVGSSADAPTSAASAEATTDTVGAAATADSDGSGSTADSEGVEPTADSVEAGTSTDAAGPTDVEVVSRDDQSSDAPETLRGHVREVVGDGSGTVRLLDAEFDVVASGEAEEAFDLLADAEEPPWAVVVDGELDQRLLDVAAQRGVDNVVAGAIGELVKRPTSVRIRTGDDLLATSEA